ncbi:MAG: helix-turn-helix domain-containing protein [Candidatus Diapherotrites archaeon]|nr:helix-turn-helix domain-containing protein [Candidatus Diapherotrites archaeon]
MAKTLEKANSLERALQLVGKKYNLLILDSLMQNRGKRRFNQLLSDVPTLNPRILSMRLKDLEKGGLLNKSLVLGTPVKTEYHLTDKAEKLENIIQNLKEWVQ